VKCHGRRAALSILGLSCATLAMPALALRSAPLLRVIVPQAPGGAMDSIARLLGDRLARSLARRVVIENRSGGGTILGTRILAQAAPDGNTIGLVVSAHAINQALRRRMPYDALTDFEPVCRGGYAVVALVARPSLAVTTVRQLIELVRRSQPTLQYASLGVGSASHLAGELFNVYADVGLQHVPYGGSAQVYRALASGDIQLAYVTLESALPHIRAGSITVLGVTNAQRSLSHPQYPAIAESLPGFEMLGFFGFLAPARTPPPIVNQLYAEIEQALDAPDLSKRMSERAVIMAVARPEVFAAFLRSEIDKYAALAKRTGITIE
jgi:tripartite-type tricarboxylate transporter receptor subunit TctC